VDESPRTLNDRKAAGSGGFAGRRPLGPLNSVGLAGRCTQPIVYAVDDGKAWAMVGRTPSFAIDTEIGLQRKSVLEGMLALCVLWS
jgi:hypothetical protein